MLNRALVVVLTISAVGGGGLIGGGCSKGSSTDEGGGNNPGGVVAVTVTGRVIGQNEAAVAGVPVVITGRPPTNSDAGGNFTIANVTAPYDISVVDAANKAALVYKGLTRTDPTLLFIGLNPGTSHAGSINGKISGGTFKPDQGASDVTRVVFASLEATGVTITAASGAFGPISLSWFGPAATTGAMHALQFTVDGGGVPVTSGYKGYGTRSGIAVNDGTTLTDQFDSLQSVPTNQFTGTVTVPPGYTLVGKAVYARVSQTALIQLIADNSPNATFSYYTPGIPGASLLLGTQIVRAGGGTGIYWNNGLPTASAGIPIGIVVPPEVSLPGNAATGIDTTVTFSWTPMAGGVHLVKFQGGAGNPAYYILTVGTSATIPNMKPFGLALPALAAYQWSVLAFGPFSSVDAAAGLGGFVAGLTGPPVSSTGDVFVGQSATRSFTTAP